MNKVKAFWQKPIGKVVILGVGIFVVFILLVHVLTPSHRLREVADQMQGAKQDIVNGDVKLTTQETLNSVAGQQARTQSQVTEMAKTQAQALHRMNKQNQVFKQSLQQDFKIQEEKLQAALDKLAKEKQKAHTVNNNASTPENRSYIVGNGEERIGDNATTSSLVWVSDPAVTAPSAKIATTNNPDSVLHPEGESEKPKPIPFFTIPANSTLVDIRPEQPLIGVIPVDGTVIDPESIQFIVGKKGLLANDWGLPIPLKGMHGSATCTGVFEVTKGSVKCAITSMTFIFIDGRITTINGTERQPLGHLTDHYGNDYIPGILHTNFGWAAGGTALFSGIQGAGGAFASSQEETTSNATGTSANTSIKSAGDFALGSFGQSGGQALNTWWQRVMKSTTNFVYVPNWNKDTHRLLLLNAVISTSVPINYNPTGRKVIYHHENIIDNNSLD